MWLRFAHTLPVHHTPPPSTPSVGGLEKGLTLRWESPCHQSPPLVTAFWPFSCLNAINDFVLCADCKVLRYQSGYADLDLSYDTVIADSPNFGECCKSCQNDPKCFAWTRVAGKIWSIKLLSLPSTTAQIAAHSWTVGLKIKPSFSCLISLCPAQEIIPPLRSTFAA